MNSEVPPSMPNANSENGRSKPSLLGRLWKWIDQRTGVDRILRQSLDEPIPGGARFAYVFGSALLFIFLSQIVTGLCLALYYVPSPLAAHASVAYIVKEVAAGSFLRSLHSYGSTAMLVVLLLHFVQTLFWGSYKGKRELLWIAGCTLALLVLGMTFTGYLLSWDQSGYSAGAVGTDIVGEVPLIGNYLRMLMRGGAMMGALTLSRFYLLHVLIIPGLIFSFIAIHVFLFRKAGAAGPATEDPVKPKLPTETFYPKQVLIDMAFVLVVMGVLGMLAHFLPVMLGPEANPANTRYIPRPEWYFLPMFQWLKYWQGWSTVIGAFIVPVILVGLFFLLPFMDRGLERRPWRRPIPVGGVLIVLIGLLWLGMTSRLNDSRDPIVAAQLAEQSQAEHAYFYSAFQPYSPPSSTGPVASTSLDATAAEGKGIFDSHGCNGCHGESGAGAIGPPLTHISGKYPPAALTSLLQAPRANMKAAGMVPLTLDAAEMKSLVSYLSSLGGTSATSAAAPAASGASTGESSTAKAGSPAGGAPAAGGKAIFDSHGCSGCHGASGGGGAGPALTNISSKYPPAKLTALLKAPRANMKAAGMVPLTLKAADMKALVSYVSSLGGTSSASATAPAAPAKAASAATPPASAAPSSAPTIPSKATAGSSADAATARGKSIFVSQRCSGCHGASGGGGAGPALTNISGKYPPAKLAALLKAPRANMKAAGMVPLTLSPADMKALVSYVTSLGGTSSASAAAPAPTKPKASATAEPSKAGSAAAPPASGAASPAPAKVEAPAGAPSTAATAATPPASGAASPAPAKAEAVSAEPSKAPAGGSPGAAPAPQGKAIFDSQRCSGCHGATGGGGVGPALTNISSKYPPAKLTALLKAPRANMKAAGMVPLTLSPADMKTLVSYVTSLGGTSSASTATPPASGSPATTAAEPTAAPALSKEESKGKAIFKTHGCADCHGTGGVGGTAAAPALAGAGKNFTPALLTTLLKHPSAPMQKGGMPPISLDGDELKALVAYVSSIAASKTNPQ